MKMERDVKWMMSKGKMPQETQDGPFKDIEETRMEHGRRGERGRTDN
jgi:hypothetical protein